MADLQYHHETGSSLKHNHLRKKSYNRRLLKLVLLQILLLLVDRPPIKASVIIEIEDQETERSVRGRTTLQQ